MNIQKTKVTRHNTATKSEFNSWMITNSAYHNEQLMEAAKKRKKRSSNNIEDAIEKGIKNFKKAEKKYNAGKLKSVKKKNKSAFGMGKLKKKAKKKIFKRILTEMYYHSLYIDDSFKIENIENIHEAVSNYVDKYGGYEMLENAIARTNSPLLKEIDNICESMGQKICMRILMESENEDDPTYDFDTTKEEDDEISYSTKSLSIDELSDLVKNKVLNVVKDEKERERKDNETMTEIEELLKDSDNIETESDIAEAMTRIFPNKQHGNDTTLFNMIMMESYKEILETQSYTIHENSDEFEYDDVYLDEEIDISIEDEITDEDILQAFEESCSLTDYHTYSMESLDGEISNIIYFAGDDKDEILEKFGDKLKKISRKVKNKFKAKRMKKDVRKMKKEVSDSADKLDKNDDKAIESFLISLDHVDRQLDSILDIHYAAEQYVYEASTKRSKGKTFKQLIIKPSDINLPDIKLSYKIKMLNAELIKLKAQSKFTKDLDKLKQIADKNIKTIESLQKKLKSDKKKLKKFNILEKAKSNFEKFKHDIDNKMVKATENFNIVNTDFTDITLDDINEGALQDEIEFDEFDDVEIVSESYSVDMDMVLAEAIGRYTLMEMCHTLQLQEFTVSEIRDMIFKSINNL